MLDHRTTDEGERVDQDEDEQGSGCLWTPYTPSPCSLATVVAAATAAAAQAASRSLRVVRS
jgi:hypothetical protein